MEHIVKLQEQINKKRIIIRDLWVKISNGELQVNQSQFAQLIKEINPDYDEVTLGKIFSYFSMSSLYVHYQDFVNLLKKRSLDQNYDSIIHYDLSNLKVPRKPSYSLYKSVIRDFPLSTLSNFNSEERRAMAVNRIDFFIKKTYKILELNTDYIVHKEYISINKQFEEQVKDINFHDFYDSDNDRVTLDDITETFDKYKIIYSPQNIEYIFQLLKERKYDFEINKSLIFRNIQNAKITSAKQIKLLKQKCFLYFNEFCEDLRIYIKDNKIDIENFTRVLFRNKKEISCADFIFLLQQMRYYLLHELEYQFIFSVFLGDDWDPNNQYIYDSDIELKLSFFLEYFKEKIPTENEFLTPKAKTFPKENIWDKKYPKYGERKKEEYLAYYAPFYPIFSKIQSKAISEEIYCMTDYFVLKSDYEADKDGYIPLDTFERILFSFDIPQDALYKNLLCAFYDTKRKKIKLFDFFGIYYLFCNDIEKPPEILRKETEARLAEEEKESHFRITIPKEEEFHLPNTSEVNAFYNNDFVKSDIVYSNRYREFKQEDIDLIKDVCEYISGIILDEKKMTPEKYFNSFDVDKKGYLPLDQLKFIIEEDIGIEIESNEAFDIFFDFLSEDMQIEDQTVVLIPRVIRVVTEYTKYGTAREPEVGKKVLGTIQQTVLATVLKNTV